MIAVKVKRSFAKSAKSYARHAALQREVSEQLIAKAASRPAPRLVLDVGSGTGFTAVEAMRQWPLASIVAVDIALPMARETKNSGVSLAVNADAATLPFKGGSFDAVVSSLALQWLITPEAGEELFRHAYGALKPGGFICLSTMVPGTLAELRQAYDAACRQCTGKGADFFPMPDAELTARLMRAAGFGDVSVERQSARRSYAGVDELFVALKGIGAAAPGRPANPPRRDILQKTRELYPATGGTIAATYEIAYFMGEKR